MIDPERLFGPEYKNAEQHLVATVQVGTTPVDVVYQYGPMQMSILPPGGYLIRYLEGYFSVPSMPQARVVGGKGGLVVRWKSSISTLWSSIPFPCEVEGKQHFAGEPFFHLEITRPHRLQLVPPGGAHGGVKVRVLRYSPSLQEALS